MKVTYVFGAGASCATIPLANKLGKDIEPTVEVIKKDLISHYSTGTAVYPEERRPPPKGSYGESLFQAMQWLCETAKNHNSIDIIARKLWMRSDPKSIEELHRLKATLAAYLWYKQISQPSDRRYDTFFGILLKKQGSNISYAEL